MLISDKVMVQTNLESFLYCTTPVVQSQLLSKSETRKLNRLWHPWEREKVDYFVLGDLWNSFDEWSAYGAGVPIVSDDGQNLIQYFVPYLSAIQIFTSNSSVNSFRDETDSVSGTRDSFSDTFSDESESEKLSRWDGCSSEEGVFEQDSFWLPNERLGNLYLQYFERSSPYGRVPLMDKISSLAQRYPGLLSLRNMDLEDGFENVRGKRMEGESISVPPFGLASYKMQGDVWMSDKNGNDRERIVSLLSVADSWLKQLRVQHHDFNYFMGIRHV
ncbi:hypothetical protein OROGR_012264 [Orobanche gracilis]